jgi:putative ABC transport system ATP-binding protein
MPLISIKNLTKIYKHDGVETPVLNGLDFSMDSGEFLAIMGPSGSGKSTLLHILGLLDEATSGEYFLDGKNIREYSKEEIAHIRNKTIGFVFQAFNLLPRASVLENVKLPLIYSNVPEIEWEGRARKAIDAVGLSHRVNHEPSQLSGGEKQRVAIARALVNDPKIIFADEPTGNLDSKSGKAVMKILQNLNEHEGHTVILITHETNTAEHAHRIINLSDGKIIDDKKVGNRQSVFNK